MTAPTLARLTSVLVVAAGALAVGHLLRPFVAGAAAGSWRVAGFVLAVAALGAWRGKRESLVRAMWDGVHPAPSRAARAAVLGATAALFAAALGFLVVHGLGR